MVKQRYELSVHTLLTIGSFVCFLVTAALLNPFHRLSEWGELELFYRLGAPLILFTLPTIVFRKRHFLKKLMNVNLLTAAGIGILIILVGFGYFTPQDRLYVGNRIMELQGVFSINTYPLHHTALFGFYMVPAVSVTWAHIDEVDSLLWKIILVLVSGFLIIVILLVQSRKVWLAVLFSGVFYCYFHPRFQSVVVPAYIVSLPLAVLGVITAYVTGFGMGTLNDRLGQYARAIPFIANNPAGRGFNSFEYLTQRTHIPHHYLFAAGTDYGILAVFFLFVVSVLIFLQLFRAAHKLRDPFVRASIAATVGLFVVINFNPSYYAQQLWLSAGIFFAYTNLALSEPSGAAAEVS